MYIEYKELIAKRNSNKVKVNEIYFTEKGIFRIDKNLKLVLYNISTTNTTIEEDNSLLLMGG